MLDFHTINPLLIYIVGILITIFCAELLQILREYINKPNDLEVRVEMLEEKVEELLKNRGYDVIN